MNNGSRPLIELLVRILETLDGSLAAGSVANARIAVLENQVRQAQVTLSVADSSSETEAVESSREVATPLTAG